MYDPAGPPLSQELIRLMIGLFFSSDSQAFQKSIFLFSLLKSNRASSDMHVAFNKLRNTLECRKDKPRKRLSLSPAQEEVIVSRRFLLLYEIL